MPVNKPTTGFVRSEHISRLTTQTTWDVIVIGGGATGLGIAVDAASRGYQTLLLEASDFAKGTSSRSTKLIHGGVRYLAQGHLGLVFSALRERGRLLKNAPHLVKPLSFIIPCYNRLEKLKYWIGLKLYDWLSGTLSLGASTSLSKQEVIDRLPGIQTKGLVGGVEYFDGQFDDARLAINLAQTCHGKGGVVLNYFKVTALHKTNSKINGVVAVDVETGIEYPLNAKTVVNATGIFVDEILKLDEVERKPLVKPSQGIHLVFKNRHTATNNALMIPKTSDGRVLFAIPWHHHLVVGTTDTAIDHFSYEPKALETEIEFILNTAQQYLEHPPTRKDILSVFVGIRPLAAQQQLVKSTKELSRDYKVIVSEAGLITITGGKWTTYRKMAEDAMKYIMKTGGLDKKPCITKTLRIHGCDDQTNNTHLSVYGSDAMLIEALIHQEPSLSKRLVPWLPYTEAEVVFAIRYEMARTVEDVLARRLRILFLDASAALKAAPRVADIIADELLNDEDWKLKQLESFNKLAQQYHINYNSKTNTAIDGKIHIGN